MQQEIEDKRAGYTAKRDTFAETKIILLAKIKEHQAEIGDLERQINKARPRTENGEKICGDCDCISMEYIGRNNVHSGPLSGDEEIYICEICGRRNEDLGLY